MKEVTFSPQRTVESLLFIACKLKNPTIHEVLKLRYFADKLHMSRYGFLASGDRYDAMVFGPVASNTYNMLKAARGERSSWIHPDFIAAVEGNLSVVDGKRVIPLRGPNVDELSPSDIECLEEAIRNWGNMSFGERTALSHDAAYEKAWKSAGENNMDAGRMDLKDIAGTLGNAEEVLEYLCA